MSKSDGWGSNPYRQPPVVKPTTVEVETDDVVIQIHYMNSHGASISHEHTFKGHPDAYWSNALQSVEKNRGSGSYDYAMWLERIGETQLVVFGDDVIPIHRLLQIKKISVTERTEIVDIEG